VVGEFVVNQLNRILWKTGQVHIYIYIYIYIYGCRYGSVEVLHMLGKHSTTELHLQPLIS
jgi:hypothetical protein